METRYTMAPVAYDGSGTVSVEVVGYWKADRQKPVRKVKINPEHLNWQTMRYHSGSYACWDQAGYDQEVKSCYILPAHLKDGDEDLKDYLTSGGPRTRMARQRGER